MTQCCLLALCLLTFRTNVAPSCSRAVKSTVSTLSGDSTTVFQNAGKYQPRNKASHRRTPLHKRQPSLLSTLHHHLPKLGYHIDSTDVSSCCQHYGGTLLSSFAVSVPLLCWRSFRLESPTHRATSVGGESTGNATVVCTGALRL